MGWEHWLDVIVPRRCRGCGRGGELWCARCSAAVLGLQPELHPPPGISGTFASAGPHDGVLRAAILTHKHDRNQAVRRVLVALLGRTLAVVAEPARAAGDERSLLLVVPVPPSALHPARLPVAELTAPVCAGLPSLVHAPILLGARRRRPQKGLDAIERARNVRGAFRLRSAGRPPAGAGAIVVDDVATTGATLGEAFATLSDGGLRPIAAVTLARAAAVGR